MTRLAIEMIESKPKGERQNELASRIKALNSRRYVAI